GELQQHRVAANVAALDRLARAAESGRDDALVKRPRTLRVAAAWERIGAALESLSGAASSPDAP
ncbi:MAG: hypothetical protein AAFY88_27500, partial [Acidobacteriota bacterium]